MSTSLHREILRWCAGLACFGLALYCARTGYEEERYTLMVLGVPIFGIGILILWRPLFDLATRPLFLLIDSIFFPGGKLSKPVLNLKLPAYYIEQERFTEARDEYRKILRHYPDEEEAYRNLIWLEREIFENRGEVDRLVRRARRRHLAIDQGAQLVTSGSPASSRDD